MEYIKIRLKQKNNTLVYRPIIKQIIAPTLLMFPGFSLLPDCGVRQGILFSPELLSVSTYIYVYVEVCIMIARYNKDDNSIRCRCIHLNGNNYLIAGHWSVITGRVTD